MWDDTLGRVRVCARRLTRVERLSVTQKFYYETVTGEIRWRKPQALLELEVRRVSDIAVQC